MNRLAVLTPPGNSAIAVIALSGPDCWPVVSSLFRTSAGKTLPDNASHSAFWFGKFGDPVADEVILVRKSADRCEIHCHGGRHVIAWIRQQLKTHGFQETTWQEWPNLFADPTAAALLPFARTVRTASILLDQAHGAYAAAVEKDTDRETLVRNARVGRHLVDPWKLVIAGAPNAGKSTLLNALAGFTRSVVSPIPGTTRDAVSVSLAFDGWPVDVVDTAGIRESPDELEEEGIRRAHSAIEESDLCLWVVDAAAPSSRHTPCAEVGTRCVPTPMEKVLVVLNKCDLIELPGEEFSGAARISASTGQGIPELIERISKRLVPHPPAPGEPVPFMPKSNPLAPREGCVFVRSTS